MSSGVPIDVQGAPTSREADGVARSSRNLRLTAEARREAVALVRSLEAAERSVAAGERSREALLDEVRREIAKSPLAEIDYAELRDPQSLAESPEILTGAALLALAVFFPAQPSGEASPAERPGDDRVRLIDNRVLDPAKHALSGSRETAKRTDLSRA